MGKHINAENDDDDDDDDEDKYAGNAFQFINMQA